MANERLDRFTKLLKEIFELDKSDLDFGIYRVMNLRKTQIEEFLTQRLPQMVQETLAPFAQGSKEEIRAQMTQIEESVAGMGMTVEALPDTAPMKQKYMTLQKSLAEGADLSALETDVYSALYSFFNRYYEDGDFISKRRYKEGVYAIPYEGEEVKLYWANQDQYYIKTSENFKDYTFVFDGITVHFRLVDATTEQNNNKENKDTKRTFMLFTEDEENYPGIKTFEYDAEAREIVIRFVYDIPEDKKRKYAEENYDAIQKWILSLRDAELIALLSPIPTGKGKETTTLLEKHLKGYVAKNTFDYFIHKDLRGFLTRELDFFIKSEVMHLEDLDTSSEARVETYLAKVKAIKRVGKIIIDFLAQIEDFQKKLWLKKKFVVETNWCITLDKIDEVFWAEIIANKAQIDEWIAMYAIDEADGWSNPPTVDFLRQNENLIIDTKHFSNTFKYALLESIPDLDEQTNGVMINGDNYHVLQLMQARYANKVNGIYIDPPYNTGSAFEYYDDNLEHSIWLSLMKQRLILLRELLSDDGFLCCHIDDSESHYVKVLLDEIFGRSNYLTTLYVRVRYPDKTLKSDMDFHKEIEQVLVYRKSYGATPNFDHDDVGYEKFIYEIQETGEGREIELGGKRVVVFESNEYKIVKKDVGDEYGLKEIWATGTILDGNSSGRFFRDYLTGRYEADGYGVLYKVYGIGDDRYDYRYFTGPKRAGATKGKYYQGVPVDQLESETVQRKKPIGGFYDLAGNFGNCRHEGGVEFRSGKKPEALIEMIIRYFSNYGDWVLDSFLGSGSTIATAHKMGRKWVGVELGDHAYTLCKVRMDNVINGDKTGISKDYHWEGGGGYHFYELAPSLLVKNDKLPIYQINPSYTFEMLCEAICKIEGFRYKPQDVFHGHSSEKRFIHITTEFINAGYIKSLSARLAEGQSLLIYGTKVQSDMVLPDNIEVKKIPKDLLEKCDFESEVQ